MPNCMILSKQINIMKNNNKQNLIDYPRQNISTNLPSLQSIHKQLLESLTQKVSILQEFFLSSSKNKKLLQNWPNTKIKQFAYNSQNIISLKNNAYYVGKISNNMIFGYGLMLYNTKRFYQGQFQNNFKHGEGFQYLPNGIYIGNYVNNKPEGKGLFIWSNGDIYEGDFSTGMKHGIGKWISKLQTYQGQWRSNKPDGIGIINNNQSKYQGQVRKGLKHGQGHESFYNGDKYSGNYVNGKPQGYGEYIWGNFKNGLRHGRGIWIQEGNRYQGNYLNDKKNGKGTFTWTSGNYYFGNYFDDQRHGYGQMYWVNGGWYKGQWRQGVQHGTGQMYEPDQPIRKGIFQNNVFVYEQKTKKKQKKQFEYPFIVSPTIQIKNSNNNPIIRPRQQQQKIRFPSFQKRRVNQQSIIPYFMRYSREDNNYLSNNKQRKYRNRSRIRKTMKTMQEIYEDKEEINNYRNKNVKRVQEQQYFEKW